MAKEYIRLNTRLDVWKDTFNDLTNDVGDIAQLSTGDTLGGDSDLVSAINELDSDIGARPHSALTTAAKDLTSAINELDAEIGSAALTTSATTLRGAINEHETQINNLDSDLGTRTSLTTDADQNIVVAINELDSDIGARPHSALTTISKNLTSAINELDSDMGKPVTGLTTVARTLTGAINELDVRITGDDANFVSRARSTMVGGNAITYTSATGNIAVTANAIEADELNVSGNGNTGQALISDGDGTFSWGRKVPNIYDSDGTLLN